MEDARFRHAKVDGTSSSHREQAIATSVDSEIQATVADHDSLALKSAALEHTAAVVNAAFVRERALLPWVDLAGEAGPLAGLCQVCFSCSLSW